MKTNDFLKIADPFIVKQINGLIPENLTGITADSREIENGMVFFCLRGHNSDGHKYIQSAVDKGASIIVGEDDSDVNGYLKVTSVSGFLKVISPVFYGDQWKKMKMIAVTGTNGKTSTTYIIENILKNCYKCGVTGTLGYRYPGKVIDAPNTTPQNWKWFSLLNEMQKSGVEVVISEASSHAIEEERMETTKFDVAVFTNLTRDHLDFHKNLENYYNAKKKLFTEHLKYDGTAVINIDDSYGMRLYLELENIKKLTISTINEKADIYIEIKDLDLHGSSIVLKYENKIKEIRIPLAGKFNIYNTVCGFAAAALIADSDYCFQNVSAGIVVPGRLEKVGGIPVYIDYAHTPDALENVLNTLRKISGSNGRIITVFGAGGDRDRGKRPVMGEIASRLSDVAIITDDNPRSEDPETIVKEILSGCNYDSNRVIEVIHDRKTAIRRALDMRKDQDIVLVAGKGAENYQITGHGKRFFSDRDEIEKYLKELQHVHNITT